MSNDKINDVKRVAGSCAYEPDSIRFHVNGSSAGGVTPQCWTSTWHRARPGSSNNVTREYAWRLNRSGGIGGLLNVKQSGQNYSYLYDGKGNVTAVIDSAEATAATYTYDAFGNLMVKTGSLDQPFQFSTKRYDAQTGLVYYGYRFYSPVQGRWITRDPLGEAGGINLYGFVGGNPVNWVDPFGLKYWRQKDPKYHLCKYCDCPDDSTGATFKLYVSAAGIPFDCSCECLYDYMCQTKGRCFFSPENSI